MILISGLYLKVNAQNDNISLSLDEVVKIASKNSLDAFRYKNMYLTSYWQFRYYKADKLPNLSMNTTPLDFNHSSERVYISSTNDYQYVQSDYLNSNMSVQLN